MLVRERDKAVAHPCAVCGGPSECVVWGDTALCYGPNCQPAHHAGLPTWGDAEKALQARGNGASFDEVCAAYTQWTLRWVDAQKRKAAA